jgi:hypothetical protein
MDMKIDQFGNNKRTESTPLVTQQQHGYNSVEWDTSKQVLVTGNDKSNMKKATRENRNKIQVNYAFDGPASKNTEEAEYYAFDGPGSKKGKEVDDEPWNEVGMKDRDGPAVEVVATELDCCSCAS